MTLVPSQLCGVFADVDRAAIEGWWGKLTDAQRQDVATLCDERLDACFFGVVADERDHVVPKVHGGRFMPPEDDQWGFDEWGLSYYEHLIEHPELVLVWDKTERTFHTGCIRHSAARACWTKGEVPGDFVCPFEHGACLMHPLRGRRVRWLRIPTEA